MDWMVLLTSSAAITKIQPYIGWLQFKNSNVVVQNAFRLLIGQIQLEKSSSMWEIPGGTLKGDENQTELCRKGILTGWIFKSISWSSDIRVKRDEYKHTPYFSHFHYKTALHFVIWQNVNQFLRSRNCNFTRAQTKLQRNKVWKTKGKNCSVASSRNILL